MEYKDIEELVKKANKSYQAKDDYFRNIFEWAKEPEHIAVPKLDKLTKENTDNINKAAGAIEDFIAELEAKRAAILKLK